MIEYVVGFCFNSDKTEVALIKKTHPDWQKNKYNGIGGHIEMGEYPIEAMIREFEEEAGVKTEESDWHKFAVMSDHKAVVHCFCCYQNHVFDNIIAMTDEIINKFVIDQLKMRNENFVPNLSWLLPLAADSSILDTIIHFNIKLQ